MNLALYLSAVVQGFLTAMIILPPRILASVFIVLQFTSASACQCRRPSISCGLLLCYEKMYIDGSDLSRTSVGNIP